MLPSGLAHLGYDISVYRVLFRTEVRKQIRERVKPTQRHSCSRALLCPCVLSWNLHAFHLTWYIVWSVLYSFSIFIFYLECYGTTQILFGTALSCSFCSYTLLFHLHDVEATREKDWDAPPSHHVTGVKKFDSVQWGRSDAVWSLVTITLQSHRWYSG